MTITMEKKEVIWKLVDQYNRMVFVGPRQRLTVGRGKCDVPLKSSSVNPEHAIVEFNQDRNCPSVKDLSSENGTFVNDQRIANDEAVCLRHGDRLRFAYDNAVYNVQMCAADCRPLATDLEQLKLEQLRRNSENAGFFPNGSSPVSQPQCRRRSVQGSDDEVFPDSVETDGHLKVMTSSPNIKDETLAAFVEVPSFLKVAKSQEEEEEEEEEKEAAVRKEEEEEEEVEEELVSPEELHPVRDVPPARAPLSFTVSLDPSDARAAAEHAVACAEEKRENLSARVPPHILKTMQEREARKQKREQEAKERREQQARERKEQERKEQEAKERREQEAKERREQEAKERKARLEREAKEKEAAKIKREGRARSSSLVRVGRTNNVPPINDTRRRNVAIGAGSGDATPARSSSVASRAGRTASVTGTRRSSSKSRQPSSERTPRLDRTSSLKMKTPAKRATSTEKRPSSSGSRCEMNSPLELPDGKSHLMRKMLDRKQPSLDAVDLTPRGYEDNNNPSEPGSPPSEAGTYTIESDKEKSKSPRNSSSLSDNDTSAPLSQTAKSLMALEQNMKNDEAERKRRESDIENTSRRRQTEDSQPVNLLYNVLASSGPNSRHTPSDQGSDAEHSPNLSARRPGVASTSSSGCGLKDRRTTAVRRSNSDTHKTNTAASSRSRQLASASATSSTIRRRMSTDNTTTGPPRKPSNPMTASYSSKAGGSLMSSSMTGPSASASSFNRTEVGRFSLKQQRPEAEARRRRMEYDPRKQAAEARVSRKKEADAAKERQRRTSSADTRPVTEGGKPAVPVSAAAAARAALAAPAVTVTPVSKSGPGVRRHESLKTVPAQRQSKLQPSKACPLAPPASAFLNVAEQSGGRSQSVSNGEASCTEVAYDLLLVSSIQNMSFRLRRGFEDLLKKLKARQIISRSPTPPGELYVAMPPAHLNSTNMELKDILENLKAMECLYQSLEARLIRDHEEDNTLSSRSQTLGGCSEGEYREEMSRIVSELQGFRPINHEEEAEEEGASNGGGNGPVALVRPQARRFESSL